jgi:hypothetical protein
MRQKIKICDYSKLYSKFPKSYSTEAFINEDGQNLKIYAEKSK